MNEEEVSEEEFKKKKKKTQSLEFKLIEEVQEKIQIREVDKE